MHENRSGGMGEPMEDAATDHVQLTEREIDILRLIVRGASTKDIGQELYASPNTIKTNLRRLYAKLGVNTRAQAAVIAVQRYGLGDSPAGIPRSG
jgi:DNA-binding CsgD family transcriptional regulator